MPLDKYLNILKAIDFWISNIKTGTAKEFAKRLNISERRLHDYLSYLREMGVPIEYCHAQRSYRYTSPGNLYIKIYFQ